MKKMIELEPTVIFDTRSKVLQVPFHCYPKEWRAKFEAWLREHEVNPFDTYRVEIYVADTIFMKVFQFDTNKEGKHYLSCSHEDVFDYNDNCNIVIREPFIVILKELHPSPLLYFGELNE